MDNTLYVADSDVHLNEETLTALLSINDNNWHKWLSSFLINDFTGILKRNNISGIPLIYYSTPYQLALKMCYMKYITRNKLRKITEKCVKCD